MFLSGRFSSGEEATYRFVPARLEADYGQARYLERRESSGRCFGVGLRLWPGSRDPVPRRVGTDVGTATDDFLVKIVLTPGACARLPLCLPL